MIFIPVTEVVVDEEKPIFQIKRLDSTQYILFANKDNIQELATYLDNLSASTKDFYLLTNNESYLHSHVVVEFYRWLKEKNIKISNASGIIHVYISYLDEFEKDEEITWRKLIF